VGTPPPQSGTPSQRGEAFRTHEMGTNNPPAIPLAPLEGGNGHPLLEGEVGEKNSHVLG